MVPISDKFVIVDEGLYDWAKNSISHLLGKRSLNRIGRGILTPEEKIENTGNIQRRLTPKPVKSEPFGMGFRGIRPFKHPKNLP